jgi:acyl-CoA synthetase (AMP-forming)/AMP-acid ligase II
MIPQSAENLDPYILDGQVQRLLDFHGEKDCKIYTYQNKVDHPLLLQLTEGQKPGFIIYSSGSTGVPKAVLHDTNRFLLKFATSTKKFRTLTFLLFDHIAGLDTLFYTLASGGTAIVPDGRDPNAICRIIERDRVEVLPTSPTFLNLLLLAQAYKKYDLSSLRIITYGSEPMGKYTLDRISTLFPKVRIIQKYGTSEFGAPPTKSKGNNELWLKMGDDRFQVKVVEGILWIKAQTAMLGYLNAPQPLNENGWICTGDEVEVKDGWYKILGRKSDIIIVGGEKVYPSEVEAVIEQMDTVLDVVVKAEPHPFLGQCVVAKVKPLKALKPGDMRKAIRLHCKKLLPAYKIPTKIEISFEALTSVRQKKIRR